MLQHSSNRAGSSPLNNWIISLFRLFERFYTVWDDDRSEPEQWKYYVLMYFLADDRVAIHESKEMNNAACGRNPYPTLLGKIRLPVDRSNLPRKYTDFSQRNYKAGVSSLL